MKKLITIITLIAAIAITSAHAQTTTVQSSAFTVQTTLAIEFRDAVCNEYNYQDSVIVNNVKVKNPQTKTQFAQAQLDYYAKSWARNVLINYRRRIAESRLSQVTAGLEN